MLSGRIQTRWQAWDGQFRKMLRKVPSPPAGDVIKFSPIQLYTWDVSDGTSKTFTYVDGNNQPYTIRGGTITPKSGLKPKGSTFTFGDTGATVTGGSQTFTPSQTFNVQVSSYQWTSAGGYTCDIEYSCIYANSTDVDELS